MDLLELIKTRQSVREYKPDSIDPRILDRCFEAARLAPSACNSQPWSFIAITQPGLIKQLSEQAFSGIYALNSFAKKAPAIIVVITERSRYIACLGGLLRKTYYNLIDVGIAVEHFVLQATAEGLGTCWIGWFNERAIHKILNIPSRRRIDVCLTVGWPVSNSIREKKRRSLDEIRSYNRYDNI
ncbi:MAG TPA: nitroreductase family protein [bacterium]|nr:nitroreductase family protein [bacterium]